MYWWLASRALPAEPVRVVLALSAPLAGAEFGVPENPERNPHERRRSS